MTEIVMNSAFAARLNFIINWKIWAMIKLLINFNSLI